MPSPLCLINVTQLFFFFSFLSQAKKAPVVSNGSATAPEAQPKASPAKAAVKKGDSPKKKAEQSEVAPKAEKKAAKQAQVKEPKPADYDEGNEIESGPLWSLN